MAWLVLLIVAAASSYLLPSHYLAPDLLNSAAPPFAPGHWLGTDPLGQDVWAVLLYGARTALLVSLPAAVLSIGLGTILGLLAGYWGNTRLRLSLSYWLAGAGAVGAYLLLRVPRASAATWWPLLLALVVIVLGKILLRFRLFRHRVAVPLDRLVLAAITLLAAIPRLVLVLVVAAAAEPSLWGVVLLLAFTSWPQAARLIRAEVSRARQLSYLEAAHAAGLPPWRIIRYHLLPTVWGPVITTFPLSLAALIALETTLSFLGVGLPPETPSWGRLLALSRSAPSAWWLLLLPALCLLATTLALLQLVPRNNQRMFR